MDPTLPCVTGAHHSIEINETLNNGRYIVAKNVYRDPKSSIWLVEDTHKKQMAMLKILTAEESRRSNELSIAQHIQQQQQKLDSHPGKDHVVSVFDTFTVVGRNGKHDCIVTEVLGISLKSNVPVINENDVKKKIVPQVALGVAYLHKCGIVHGSLNRGNVLFYSQNLQEFKHYDRHYGSSTQGSEAIIKSCLPSNGNVHIKITDFSEAVISQPNPQVVKPFKTDASILYRAPEMLLNEINTATFATDIWALGVLLFTILNHGYYPFPNDEQENINAQLCSMVFLLGRFPGNWWDNKWTVRSEYFFQSGKWRAREVETPMHHFERMPMRAHYSSTELKEFSLLFKQIFNYTPERRITAEQVVQGMPDGWKVVKRRPQNHKPRPKGDVVGTSNRNSGVTRASSRKSS